MRRAFTLVECLTGLAIMAILLGLLLPAVQRAREAANRARCGNHLRQIALAWHAHDAVTGALPGGGLGWMYPPDYAAPGSPLAGPAQRGGWGFQLLPFIEQDNAWLQTGAPTVADCQRRAIGHVVPLYFCPARGAPRSFVVKANYGPPGTYPHAQADYAAAAGTNWEAGDGAATPVAGRPLAAFVDGTSNTLLLGEKFLARSTGPQHDDNEGYTAGWDVDTIRFASRAFPPATAPGETSRFRFGGPHPGGVMMAMADGSIRLVPYSLSPTVWQALSTVAGGEPGTP
jgi:prepilin-type N-terminal cleavage/methylation domain-containing protein/prepilin-type processing-associated H-X9-DG protein